MQNEGVSATLVFLLFAESITFESFFYMIGVSGIPQKSIKKRCQTLGPKRYAKSMPKSPKTGARVRQKAMKKMTRFRTGSPDDEKSTPGVPRGRPGVPRDPPGSPGSPCCVFSQHKRLLSFLETHNVCSENTQRISISRLWLYSQTLSHQKSLKYHRS